MKVAGTNEMRMIEKFSYSVDFQVRIVKISYSSLSRVSLFGGMARNSGMEWWNGTVEWNNGMESFGYFF